MLSGKRFELMRPTTGIELFNGRPSLVTIPAYDCFRVLFGPYAHDLPDERLVCVLWEGRRVALFAVDVEERGIEIKCQDSRDKSYNSASA